MKLKARWVLALIVALVATTALISTPAGAATIQVTGLSGRPAQFTYNGTTVTDLTGQFSVTVDGVWESPGFCVELGVDVIAFEAYSADLVPVADDLKFLEAAWLMEEYSTGLGYDPPGTTMDSTANSALQLAIWEVITDSTYDFTTGDFTVGFFSSGVQSLAQSFLDSLPATLPTALADDFFIVRSEQGQDILVKNLSPSGGEVPEPGTLVLLGSILVLGGGVRRWKSRKA